MNVRTTKVYSITMPPELALHSPVTFDLRELVRSIAPSPSALQSIRENARRQGSNNLSMAQIDREVAAVRNTPGRTLTTPQNDRSGH